MYRWIRFGTRFGRKCGKMMKMNCVTRNSHQIPLIVSTHHLIIIISTSSRHLANWILRFIMVVQTAFRLPDVVIGYFGSLLLFLVWLVRTVMRLPDVRLLCTEQCRPWVKLKFNVTLHAESFSIYPFSECIESSGTHRKSKLCLFQCYPFHPQMRMRSPCGAPLLNSVQLASRKTYFYPFLMYCYLGLDVSLQSMFDHPSFFNDCEKWRSMSNGGKLRNVWR